MGLSAPSADAETYSFNGTVSPTGGAKAHAFTVRVPSRIDATLNWTKSTADLNLALKSPTGATVASRTSRTAKPERLTFTSAATGSWKLLVTARNLSTAYALNIVVTPLNRPPNAVNDTASTFVTAPLTIDVLGNDTDPDRNDLRVRSVSTPSQGGTAVVTNNQIGYTPRHAFAGTESFAYQACDVASSSLCDSAQVSVTVINRAPNALGDSATTLVATDVSIDVLDNDREPDGDSLTVRDLAEPSDGSASVDGAGTVTYSPAPGFSGSDSFTYEACDDRSPTRCDVAKVTIAVNNRAPTARNDREMIPPDEPASLDPLANDDDPDGDPLSIGTLSEPGHGVAVAGEGGKVIYTPTAGFIGTDAFTYQACDGHSPPLCDSGEVMVRVGNTTPDAVDDTARTVMATEVTVEVLTNDDDPDGDPLVLGAISTPAQGTATKTGEVIAYSPTEGYIGSDSFTYEICDDRVPVLCDTATVWIEVLNRPPLAQDDRTTIELDSVTTIDALENDSEPDGDAMVVAAITPAAHGTVGPEDGGDGISYVPEIGFVGTDSFTYDACDDRSPPLCDTAQVTVRVGNTSPLPSSDEAITSMGTPTSLDVLGNDSDPDGDPLIVTTVSAPAGGTTTIEDDGSITYAPQEHFLGSDSFTYEACDDRLPVMCALGEVTLTVTPEAKDDRATIATDTVEVIDVLANDRRPPDSDLAIGSLSIPQHGEAVVGEDRRVVYTPPAGFVGTDSFTYEACDVDSPSLCDSADVTVRVGNTSPDASDDVHDTVMSTEVTLDVRANDDDPDGDPLVFASITTPAHGTAAEAEGRIVYRPEAGFIGSDSFSYEVCDDRVPVLCDTATASIEVKVPPSAQDFKGFYLWTPNPQDASDELKSPLVGGLSLLLRWSDLEPTYGQFDFSEIDLGLALAREAGDKPVMIRVSFGNIDTDPRDGVAFGQLPSWLFAPHGGMPGAEKFAFEDSYIATFWDPTQQRDWTEFLTALSEHVDPVTGIALKDNRRVLIYTTGPWKAHGEPFLPACPTTLREQWVSQYRTFSGDPTADSDDVADAYDRFVTDYLFPAFSERFPHRPSAMAAGLGYCDKTNLALDDPDRHPRLKGQYSVARQLYGGLSLGTPEQRGFFIQYNGLSQSPDGPEGFTKWVGRNWNPVDGRVHPGTIGYQFVCGTTVFTEGSCPRLTPAEFATAVRNAISYHASYIEVYGEDLKAAINHLDYAVGSPRRMAADALYDALVTAQPQLLSTVKPPL